MSSFRYLGHILSDTLCDNDDIHREIKNMFIRTTTNVLDIFIHHKMIVEKKIQSKNKGKNN